MNKDKQVILVVDDTALNLALVTDLLKGSYKIKVATNGERALAIAAASPPDLILLDVMMPVMDGYETCRRLKADERLRDIPVIFLTAKSKVEDEEFGFSLGAVDYIAKPISPPLLIARVKTHLALKQASDFLRDQNTFLEAEVARRIKEIALIQEVSIVAMASLAETRDNETGGHLQRTQQYVRELAVELRGHERFRDFLTAENISLIVKSTPLHDIGKVGISDHILLKPAKLTADEFEQMKKHTILGHDAIVRAEEIIDQPETFLHFAREIALSHHEKWDGSGYPEGLAGEAIPVAARLMAVADVYDALISNRVYKQEFPHETAVTIIREGMGSHFDPAVAEAFLRLEKRFAEIGEQFADRQISV